MSKGENTTGWVKLHRQTADQDHFQMPDICFKLWVYCLLKAQPIAREEQAAGTLLLSYGEIQDNLRQPGRVFSKSTIAAALRYLQERGYLLVERTSRRLIITVQNWQRYTEDQPVEETINSSKETKDVEETSAAQLPSTPAVPQAEPVGTVAVHQEFSGTPTVPMELCPGTVAVHQESSSTPTVPMESCPGTVAVHQESSGTPTVPMEPCPGTVAVHQESSGTPTVPMEPCPCTVAVHQEPSSTLTVPESPKNALDNYQVRKDRFLKDRGLKDRCITPQTPLRAGNSATVEQVFAQFPRYNCRQQSTLQQYWQNIGQTRNGDNFSIASIREYMHQWERYPVELVIEAMEIHLQRYPDKRVSYTDGILQRLANENKTKQYLYPGGDRDGQVGSSPDTHPIYGAPSRFAHLLR